MWVLPLLGYVGIIAGFGFLTLAIASGLYYLSELVEEHTVLSKRILTHLIQAIIVVHLLLLALDGFPLLLTLFSAASHAVYLANVSRTFPMVRLTDPVFLLSCVLVVANHFLWFQHFSVPPPHEVHSPYEFSSPSKHFPSFTEISSFFGICVWMVPFSLFVSLSAAENVLPSTSTGVGSASGVDAYAGIGGAPGEGRKTESMAKAVFGGVKEYVSTSGEALGLWKGESTRHARFE